MTRGLSLLTLIATLPVVAGYLGAWHPIGDSLAVFRFQAALILILVAAFSIPRRARWAGWTGLIIAIGALAPLLWAYLGPAKAGTDLRLYQKNMLYNNASLNKLEQDIRATDPDVLTLQEVSYPNRALLKQVEDILPHQLWCPGERIGSVAVATRLEPVPNQKVCQDGLAALKVNGPKGTFWLISVHVGWPWPYYQQDHLARHDLAFQEMEAPIVIAGDFNMVMWSDAMEAVRYMTGTIPAGPVRGTYTGFAPWLVLPIDHILAPNGGRIETRPGLGSDHLGLLGELSL